MASQVSGIIEYIQPGESSGTKHAIASTAYGYCDTPAGTAAKTVDMTGFKLETGVTIYIKFKERNSASNPTLNVQSTGAKNIVQYGTTKASTIDETSGWYAGAVISFTYDGTSWVRNQGFNTNTTYTFTDGTGGFTVTPSGGSAQTVSIGKPSTAGTADKATAANITTTANGIAYYSDNNGTFASTSAGDSGYVLIGNGSSSAPSWQQYLSIAHGGTGLATTSPHYVFIGPKSTSTGAPSWRLLEAEDLPLVPVTKAGLGATTFTNGCVITPSITNSVQSFSSTGLQITGAVNDHIILSPNDSNKNMTISSTNILNLNSATNKEINFQNNGTIWWFFDANGKSVQPTVTKTNTISLGISGARWKSLYLGTADTYGDAYTPIYWNNGVPAATTITNKSAFTIASGTTSATISQSHTYKTRTVVTEIVVETGMQYLNNIITWTNSSGNIILNTATETSGDVTGYILTSTGPA